ncbi:MAG: pseudouridine-5'-phosphate glycosidase, partial [Acidimicrobiales bacterium]
MSPVHIHPEVAAALASGKPVVALESTVITHGLDYPVNVETARSMEAAVREGGALPATVAVIDGVPTVGLNGEQIDLLGRSPDVRKCSRRDLPIVIGLGETAGTTVAGTMIL